jgi:TadE-like protein
MLFGLMAAVFALLLVFEATVYWHARNVFDEAAAEGARVAATFDGSCAAGVDAALRMVDAHAGNWGRDARVTCTEGPTIVVTVMGRTPGVLGAALGFQARVSESAPKEQ